MGPAGHRVGADESLIYDRGVSVRALDDVDALAYLGREVGGVSHDDAKRLAGVDEVLEDLAADLARGGGDDDHDCLLKSAQIRLRVNVRAARPSVQDHCTGL